VRGGKKMDWDPPPTPQTSDLLYFIIDINYDNWIKSNNDELLRLPHQSLCLCSFSQYSLSHNS
jgi:hypothetical protein